MNAKLVTGLRILLGLMFTVFGLNGFLNFIPVPPMPENIAQFFTAMMATKYFFPLLKGTETVCGILLLTKTAVPASLVILAPITLHICLFHAFMTPGLSNMVMPLVIATLQGVLMWNYCDLYRPLFRRV